MRQESPFHQALVRSALALVVLGASVALAVAPPDPICTAEEFVLSSNPVTAGASVDAISRAWQLGTSGAGCVAGTAGSAVTAGTSDIWVKKAGALFARCDAGRLCTAGNVGAACTLNSQCDTSPGNGVCTLADFVKVVNGGTVDVNGEVRYAFDTTGLGGKVIGFKGTYKGTAGVDPPRFKAPSGTPPPCIDLVVNEPPACSSPLSIAATLASGDGMPAPGATKTTLVGPWIFRITVTACENVTHVSAQGGDNGWAPTKSDGTWLSTDTGTKFIRKVNNKSNVIGWTIGNMTAGQTANLWVQVNGPIPPGTPDCLLRYLTGAWSALYSTDGGLTKTKTDYTGRVTIQVDVQGDNTCP